MKMQVQARVTAVGEARGTSSRGAADVLRFDQTAGATAALAASQAMPGVVLPMLQPGRVHEMNRARRSTDKDHDLREAAALYESAIGEAPHEVSAAGRAVLIETGVAGSYEDFPNGYVPILMSRTANGWVVFDTGQTASKPDVELDVVLSDANMLYVKTGKDPDEVRRGIRTLVSTLQNMNHVR